jgi:hypothetical protein
MSSMLLAETMVFPEVSITRVNRGVFVLIFFFDLVRFGSVPCGGDTLLYFSVCRKDLSAYF